MQPGNAFWFCISVTTVLAVFSYLIGVGWFSALVSFSTVAGSTKTLLINLGYLQQLNYVPWYLTLCPFVFMLSTLSCRMITMSCPGSLHARCDVATLTRRPAMILIGLVVLVLFLRMNLLVERQEYKTLGLGWVQGEALDEANQLLQRTGRPEQLPKVFYDLEDQVDGRVGVRAAILRGVQPSNFHVRSHVGMIVFIVAAKTWVSVWEALVSYLGIVLAVIFERVLRSVGSDGSPADGAYGLKWLQRPVAIVFVLGLLINAFACLRFVANVNKGSWGSFDQYWELLILSIPLIPAAFGVALFVKCTITFPNASDSLLTKSLLWGGGFWVATFVWLGKQILGYVDAPSARLFEQLLQMLRSK